MQQTYADLILAEYQKLLDEEFKDRSNKLVLGASIASYDEYRYRVGFLAGLTFAYELLGEAKSLTDVRT